MIIRVNNDLLVIRVVGLIWSCKIYVLKYMTSRNANYAKKKLGFTVEFPLSSWIFAGHCWACTLSSFLPFWLPDDTCPLVGHSCKKISISGVKVNNTSICFPSPFMIYTNGGDIYIQDIFLLGCAN